MQEITFKNSSPKRTGAGAGKGARKSGLGVNLTSFVTGGSAFCICAGLFLLGTLNGGSNELLMQRVGLALVFIPVLILGFALKPYEKGD